MLARMLYAAGVSILIASSIKKPEDEAKAMSYGVESEAIETRRK